MTQTQSLWWQYADRKRIELDLSVAEFAQRGGIGKSHAYQILKGERPQATLETLRAVARGLGMTPADFLAAMGDGAEDEPDVAEAMALYRQVPSGQRSTARDLLRALTPANSHLQPSAKSPKGSRPNLKDARLSEHKNGTSPPITQRYDVISALHAFVQRSPLALSAG